MLLNILIRKRYIFIVIKCCSLKSSKTLSELINTETVYLLCSDGFRHKITPGEMAQCFAPQANTNAAQMRANIRALIELNKQRMEKDNITAALIRTL